MKVTRKLLRYHSIYGAFVALQVQDRMVRGLGPLDHDLMRNFVEEAHAVAEMAQDAEGWNPEEEDEDNKE
jgi:hypothetical protein